MTIISSDACSINVLWSVIDDSRSIIDDSRSIIDDSRSINDDSRSIIDDSRSIIDDSRSIIDDHKLRSILWHHSLVTLEVSFMIIIFL
jgi:hypothetical protein